MNSYKRSGNRWTVNELISLQREYELLEWTVGQISEKHQRSVEAILFRLESEGFISSWNNARGFKTDQYQENLSENIEFVVQDNISVDEDEDYDAEDSEYFDEGDDEDDMSIDDDEPDVNKLTERVCNLETSVSEISSMMKQMFDSWVSDKSKNRSSPRNSSLIQC